jgi:hypothetical protein
VSSPQSPAVHAIDGYNRAAVVAGEESTLPIESAACDDRNQSNNLLAFSAIPNRRRRNI